MNERSSPQLSKVNTPTVNRLPGLLLQRQCACGQHTGGGECATCQQRRDTLQRAAINKGSGDSGLFDRATEVGPAGNSGSNHALVESRFQHDFSHIPIRAKLTVGSAHDSYEQEADRVAEQVMRTPAPTPEGLAAASAAPGMLQAKEAPGHNPEVPAGVQADINAMRGGGQPLPLAVRAFFEPRFGLDFSQVKVHNDARASASASAVNAMAYTVGRDIVFGAGQYAPETSSGRYLLAHELTHVIQQGAGANAALQRKPLTLEEKKQDLKAQRFRDNKRLQNAYDNSPAMRKFEKDKEAVKILQRALHDLGYPMPITFKDGDADGLFEKETFDTLWQFQTDYKLSQDGAAGRETLGKLDELYATTLTLKSVRFTSNQRPMKDNKTDWEDSGPAFPNPEWTSTSVDGKSAPISHIKAQPIQVELTYDVTPASVSGLAFTLEGTSAQSFLSFQQSGNLNGGTDQTLALTSQGVLPDRIEAYSGETISWSANILGDLQALGQSLDHEVFATINIPGGGVTYKRMAKAVELTKGFSNDSHAIVKGQMARFPGYTFCPKCAYFGNIWPIADDMKGECQAIVRFVQAVNNMVGVPGLAEGVTVYASPSDPDTPLVGVLTALGGPGMANFPPDPKTGFAAFLFDGSNAANNYEAALKFTFGNTVYYPGGIAGATLNTPLQVLHTFKKMSWSKFDVALNKQVPVTLIRCYHPPC